MEAIRDYFLAKGDTGAATLVSVMAYLGVRPPQEATALRWEDWNANLRVSRRNAYGTIVEATKTGQARTISVPEPVRADLAAWRLATPHSEGLIFPAGTAAYGRRRPGITGGVATSTRQPRRPASRPTPTHCGIPP